MNPQPTGGGTPYTYGQTATVTAQSVTGYTFQKWTESGVQVSTSMSYSFTATSGIRNLVAVYTPGTPPTSTPTPTPSPTPSPTPTPPASSNPTLAVDKVWTMDGNNADKTNFNPGDVIHYGAIVKNGGSSTL